MLTRRDFMHSATLASLSIGLSRRAGAQTMEPVRLLVLRRIPPTPADPCKARCIRGRLYDLSGMVTDWQAGGTASLETLLPLITTFGEPVCDVVERPWKNNQPNASSIPQGIYGAKIRDQATKSWMNDVTKWRIELMGTGNRSFIQFHYGTSVDWSAGCFIVGKPVTEGGDTAAYCQLQESEASVQALREGVEAAGRNRDDVLVAVTDHSGLFAEFGPIADCPSDAVS